MNKILFWTTTILSYYVFVFGYTLSPFSVTPFVTDGELRLRAHHISSALLAVLSVFCATWDQEMLTARSRTRAIAWWSLTGIMFAAAILLISDMAIPEANISVEMKYSLHLGTDGIIREVRSTSTYQSGSLASEGLRYGSLFLFCLSNIYILWKSRNWSYLT